MKRIKLIYTIVMIGVIAGLTSCSYISLENQENIEEQIDNLTNIYGNSLVPLSRYLSPSGQWLIEPITTQEINDKGGISQVHYKVISTKDPNIILNQVDDLGIVSLVSWAPDETSFVATGTKEMGVCTIDRVIIYHLGEEVLTPAVFSLPEANCTSVDWSTDGSQLAISQSGILYIISSDGELIQQFQVKEYPEVRLSSILIDKNKLYMIDSFTDSTKNAITIIDLANPNDREIILTEKKNLLLEDFHPESDSMLLLEQETNKVWLFVITKRQFQSTVIEISGRVVSMEFAGKPNLISVYYEDTDKFKIDIYDIEKEKLVKRIEDYSYIGWYSDFQGILVWRDVGDTRELLVIN